MKIGVFGGTFNPIHLSHLDLVELCIEKLDLDHVILVPTYLPPHKTSMDLACAEDRYAMCLLAVENHPKVKVSDYEIQRKEVNYTYQTLEYFHSQFPNCEYYFLMGSDMYLTVQDWVLAERIFELASICAVARDDESIEKLEEHKQFLSTKGAKSVLVTMSPKAISSTEIRQRLRDGQSLEEYLDPKVEAYAKSHKLYQGKDKQMTMEEYAGWLKPLMDEKRYHHSLCVAKQAVSLAEQQGVDKTKAEIAGLLHDCCKRMPLDDQLQYLKQHDILLNVETLDNPALWHGITASVYVKEVLGIHDEDILGAIRWHTTGKAKMTPLEEVVFLADYTSEDRQYPDADRLREMLPQQWDEAILEGISYGISAALKGNRPLVPEAVSAYHYYLAKVKEQER